VRSLREIADLEQKSSLVLTMHKPLLINILQPSFVGPFDVVSPSHLPRMPKLQSGPASYGHMAVQQQRGGREASSLQGGRTADLRGRPGRLLPPGSGNGSARGALRVTSRMTY